MLHVLEPIPLTAATGEQRATFDGMELWIEWLGEKPLLMMKRGRREELLRDGLRPFVDGRYPGDEALNFAEQFLQTPRG